MKRACSGAGQIVALRAPPSSLVACPVCGRRALGARRVNSVDDTGVVPPHSAAGRDRVRDALRAHAANQRDLRSEDDVYRDMLNRWYDSREWGR